LTAKVTATHAEPPNTCESARGLAERSAVLSKKTAPSEDALGV
jgi:hypothetical protein